jgi:hypothetical protein
MYKKNGDDEVTECFLYGCFTFRYGGRQRKYLIFFLKGFESYFCVVGFVENMEEFIYGDDFSKIDLWWSRSNIENGGWWLGCLIISLNQKTKTNYGE